MLWKLKCFRPKSPPRVMNWACGELQMMVFTQSSRRQTSSRSRLNALSMATWEQPSSDMITRRRASRRRLFRPMDVPNRDVLRTNSNTMQHLLSWNNWHRYRRNARNKFFTIVRWTSWPDTRGGQTDMEHKENTGMAHMVTELLDATAHWKAMAARTNILT